VVAVQLVDRLHNFSGVRVRRDSCLAGACDNASFATIFEKLRSYCGPTADWDPTEPLTDMARVGAAEGEELMLQIPLWVVTVCCDTTSRRSPVTGLRADRQGPESAAKFACE
jgi:hypothetical protein